MLMDLPDFRRCGRVAVAAIGACTFTGGQGLPSVRAGGRPATSILRPPVRSVSELESQIMADLKRSRRGYQAFAASVDLVATQALMKMNPHEARQRVNDLQQGVGEALQFFPGGEHYRVCLAGDAVFVIREIDTDEDSALLWPAFCGRIFALASFMHQMERGIGNAGFRAIVAYGPLFQLTDPDSWKRLPWHNEVHNWFVLTGPSIAFKKCCDAERAGRKGGFLPSYCWHEQSEEAGSFLGTPLQALPLEWAMHPELYAEVHSRMITAADRTAALATSL